MRLLPGKSLFEEVAVDKGVDSSFVEKDWYVTQLIDLVARFRFSGVTLIFTGGTALSKAHHLLQRFSEDIDFRLSIPELETQSNNQQRSYLSKLKNDLINHINTVFPINADKITARNGNRFFSMEIDYPSSFPQAAALRAHILLEFTVAGMALPSINCAVASFVHEYLENEPEVVSISCTDPVENAADKLSAFVWRVIDRERGTENDDATIVRHLHDLAILADRAMAHPKFKALALATVGKDTKRSNKTSGLSLTEKFEQVKQVIAIDEEYDLEYQRFVQGMSYSTSLEVPNYKFACAQLNLLLDFVELGDIEA
ncbi:MAG: nucleotidyl transferase AbiEii/AbiGii toxin family protein [Chitinophagaceae bacterium]